MIKSILGDVVGVYKSVFMGGDMIGLAIAAVAVLVAALSMNRSSQIGSMTLLSLVLFALGGFVRGVLNGAASGEGSPAVQAGGRALGQINESWASFSEMQAGHLVAYFIAFMILILLIYALRSTVGGGGGGGGGGHH